MLELHRHECHPQKASQSPVQVALQTVRLAQLQVLIVYDLQLLAGVQHRASSHPVVALTLEHFLDVLVPDVAYFEEVAEVKTQRN